jgi:hypothetical protein
MASTEKNIDIIIEAFAHLERKIELYSCLNLHDINIHLEYIFRDVLNVIYKDRIFSNLNEEVGNFTAIDLGDDISDIAIQVTTTTTRNKVNETIAKYNVEYDYKKIVMLYCVTNKPKRKEGFICPDMFVEIEEWDIQDLLTKIRGLEFTKIEKIANLLITEVISKIPDISKNDDETAYEIWEQTNPIDARNINDKLKSVCSTIQNYRIKKYSRDIVSGQIEISKLPERYISAMKYRIFEVCQEELIKFIENNSSSELLQDEIDSLIEKYTDRAVMIIKDKANDYTYPLQNRDLLRKLVLALIDECYLSFDMEGVYV